MEKKKTLFDYLTQIAVIYGITMLVLYVFGRLVGEEAKAFSTIFKLGGEGIAFDTSMQFLGIAVLITGIRIFYFTDIVLKKAGTAWRTIGMVLTVIGVIGGAVYCFGWFPVDMWQCWGMFFLCFGICFVISAAVSLIKERAENKALEEALQRFQKNEVSE